jgi:hypothetical protein
MAAARLRPMKPTDRKILLAEIERLSRQERNSNEQMIERFLQCPEAQHASEIIAFVNKRIRYPGNNKPIPTPSALLPWLQ